MPLVIVEMWEGRTIEQKRQLVADITSAMMKVGAPREEVQIIIRDIPKHNWASGGTLSSDKAAEK